LQPFFPFDKHRFQYFAWYPVQNLAGFCKNVVLLREPGPLQQICISNAAKQNEIGRGQINWEWRMRGLIGCFPPWTLLFALRYAARHYRLEQSVGDSGILDISWESRNEYLRSNNQCRSVRGHVNNVEALGTDSHLRW
jgi:hypothetical protein